MILIDLNQVILSGIMGQITWNDKNAPLTEDSVRYMVLNLLRNHVKKFRPEYGEVILCCDNRKYWRKEIFPLYKAARKKDREKSPLDWNLILSILGTLKEELKQNFPYKVLDVERAEADDIIGTLAPRHAANEKVLIISSDGDFLQLQKYNNVFQYNPTEKKYLKSENPHSTLKEKIIRGDKGDGIPNILSADDVFVRQIRQTSVTAKKFDEYINASFDADTDEKLLRNWKRNQQLIDLTFIPHDIQESIIHTYENTKPASKQVMLNYFFDKKLKNLMEVIEDF